MNPKVGSIGDRALDRTMRARRTVTIVRTIRLTTNRPNPAINCVKRALLTIGLTAISNVLKPKTVIAAAPTQAMIDKASRTKPRAKAKIADSTMMAMTPRSSGFMAGSWRDRDPARATFRRRDKLAARRRQARHELAQMADLDSPQPLGTRRPPAGWPLRDPGLGKAKLGGFLEARFGMTDRPHGRPPPNWSGRRGQQGTMPRGSAPRRGRDHSSRRRRSHRSRQSGFLRRAGCGIGDRVRLRNRARCRPCARGRAGRRSALPS